ncbi:hypothetical protein BRADI_3g60968v3 [Brachypodium distachyon]|uniref:Uncharacterized protein n=1 Tax=Brachypodium distachyon TaxID=15368 RepID=A0A2K2D643_BRADI|nr:hypothetical protein BRADI_3g60968v3 [Brachypodium distachyon]
MDPSLAMTVCNNYNRLKKSLKTAARSFVKQSLKMESEPKLTLKILGCPVKHQLLREHLQGKRSVEVMEVYGHKINTIYNPTPDYTLVLQGIICFILMKHKSGFSWNGGFSIGDIEVINGNIFIITKPPQKFTDLEKLIEAMEKDFLTYAELFLDQPITMVLSSDHHKAHQVDGQYHVPYLTEFHELFKDMRNYCRIWSNDDLAESFRDLIRHHPFLKPPLVIAHFLSEIYSAWRSHDLEDADMIFKAIADEYAGWMCSLNLDNSMVYAVLTFKVKKMVAIRKEKESKGIIPEEDEEPWPPNLGSMVEFIRHLFNHGPDYSKEEGNLRLVQHEDGKIVPYGDKKPQKQLMRTLEETEVAAAVGVAKFVCKLILRLVETKCILGTWLLPMWKAYKNSSSSSTSIDERAMEQWDKWWQPDEEADEDDEE